MSGSTRIGALRADLDLETAAWEGSLRTARTSMSRAQQQIERSLTAMQAQTQRTSAAFGSLGAAAGALRSAFAPLAAALSIGGLVGMTRNALNAAGGLGELAEQAGVSVEGLQILRFAATQTGISTGQLDAGLARLSRTLGEAGEGSRAALDAFARLGVNVRDSAGRLRTAEQVLPEIAEALSRIPDPATRAAAAVGLFGRGGQALLPLLSQGAAGFQAFERQARSFGAVLSEELSARADVAGDAFAALNQQIAVLQQRFAAGLAPAILQGVQLLQEGLRGLNALLDNPSLRNLLLGGAAGGTVAGGAVSGGLLGARAGAVFGPLGAAVGGTAGAVGGATVGALGGAAILGQTTTALQDAEAALARVQARLDELRARGPAFAGDAASTANWQQAVGRLEAQVAQARAEVDRLTTAADGTRRTFDAVAEAAGKVARAVKEASDIATGVAGGALPSGPVSGTPAANTPARGGGGARQEPQLRQYIQSLQDAVRLAQAEAAAANDGNAAREVARALIEAETRARADHAARLRASAELTAAERAEIEAATRARAEAVEQEQSLNRLRAEGERVTQAVATAQERMSAELARLNELLAAGAISQETYNRAAQQLKDEISGVADVAAQLEKALTSAFVDAVAEGKSFGEVLRSLERDLLRIGTQMAARSLLGSIFGDGGGGAGGGGMLSGLVRGIGSLFGGFRAAGGPVDPSRYYVVGERGPELFRPTTAGVIEPNGGGAGRQGMAFHFHGIRDMDGFRQSQSAVAAAVSRGARAGGRNL
jgi:hypothetical protein